jgi:hypothetical protein
MNSSIPLLNINNSTSFSSDPCIRDIYVYNNNRIFDYSFDPSIRMNVPNGSRDQYLHNTQIRGVLESKNPDTNGQYIQTNTSLRNGVMTHDGHRMQLDTRLFPGSPFMAQGQSTLKNTDLSTRLLVGQETRSQKSQGSTNDVSIDNFIPLLPCIKDNVQNTKHIIPEYWVRGGMSTRSVIRNIDYVKSCGGKK